MDCSPPDSSVHGILISFSRRPSQPKDLTHVPCLAGGFFTTVSTGNSLLDPQLLKTCSMIVSFYYLKRIWVVILQAYFPVYYADEDCTWTILSYPNLRCFQRLSACRLTQSLFFFHWYLLNENTEFVLHWVLGKDWLNLFSHPGAVVCMGSASQLMQLKHHLYTLAALQKVNVFGQMMDFVGLIL